MSVWTLVGRQIPPRPGVHYIAYMATAPTGHMAYAIAHMEPDGTPIVDCVKETVVQGGDAGIDDVYRGLRKLGIIVNDFRKQAGPHRATAATVVEQAIQGAILSVRTS